MRYPDSVRDRVDRGSYCIIPVVPGFGTPETNHTVEQALLSVKKLARNEFTAGEALHRCIFVLPAYDLLAGLQVTLRHVHATTRIKSLRPVAPEVAITFYP